MKRLEAPWMKLLVWAIALLLPGGFVLLSAFVLVQRRTRSPNGNPSADALTVSPDLALPDAQPAAA